MFYKPVVASINTSDMRYFNSSTNYFPPKGKGTFIFKKNNKNEDIQQNKIILFSSFIMKHRYDIGTPVA